LEQSTIKQERASGADLITTKKEGTHGGKKAKTEENRERD